MRKAKKTKDILHTARPGDFLLLQHENMDEVICADLLNCRIRAVLNTRDIVTQAYPNPGPLHMEERGVILLERVSPSLWYQVMDGDILKIEGPHIFRGQEYLGAGYPLHRKEIVRRYTQGIRNHDGCLTEFVENTLQWAWKERHDLLKMEGPKVQTELQGRPVLVVVRGRQHREDLETIIPFIDEEKPVILAVDGGADACLALGIRPHVLVGDMDSASDGALKVIPERVVHAYRDGRAPGARRLDELNLSYSVFPGSGTSEDIALLLAYEGGASLIVTVGSHSSLLDFLAKGRPGMGSTLLIRLRLGPLLVDARGVSSVYRRKAPTGAILTLLAAALLPLVLATILSPTLRSIFYLFLLQARLFFGF